MNNPDTRWLQRFENYKGAFEQLQSAVRLASERPLSDLEQQGLIKAFEFTHELGWNVLKDYLEEEGIVGIIGSKSATREAFQKGLIEDGEIWMEMIKARNLTTHTYDSEVAEAIAKNILNRFASALEDLKKRFDGIAASGEGA